MSDSSSAARTRAAAPPPQPREALRRPGRFRRAGILALPPGPERARDVVRLGEKPENGRGPSPLFSQGLGHASALPPKPVPFAHGPRETFAERGFV